VKFSTKRKKKKENLVEYLLEENKQFFSNFCPIFSFWWEKQQNLSGEKIHGSPQLELCVSSFAVRIVRFIICFEIMIGT